MTLRRVLGVRLRLQFWLLVILEVSKKMSLAESLLKS